MIFRAWSSCRNLSDGWTDSTNDNENKDWPTTQASPAPAFTDLVPEFEPGKPWKVILNINAKSKHLFLFIYRALK